MLVYTYVCRVFEDFSRLRTLTEPRVVPYGKVVNNTLLRLIFTAVVFLARGWQLILVPIDLSLWSGQLPAQWTSFTLLNIKCNYYRLHFFAKNTLVIFVFDKK